MRNEALRRCRRLGRAIWKRWTRYYRRSLIEAKMRSFKLLGERVMSRDFDRQVAEIQIRAAKGLEEDRRTRDYILSTSPALLRS